MGRRGEVCGVTEQRIGGGAQRGQKTMTEWGIQKYVHEIVFSKCCIFFIHSLLGKGITCLLEDCCFSVLVMMLFISRLFLSACPAGIGRGYFPPWRYVSSCDNSCCVPGFPLRIVMLDIKKHLFCCLKTLLKSFEMDNMYCKKNLYIKQKLR